MQVVQRSEVVTKTKVNRMPSTLFCRQWCCPDLEEQGKKKKKSQTNKTWIISTESRNTIEVHNPYDLGNSVDV